MHNMLVAGGCYYLMFAGHESDTHTHAHKMSPKKVRMKGEGEGEDVSCCCHGGFRVTFTDLCTHTHTLHGLTGVATSVIDFLK